MHRTLGSQRSDPRSSGSLRVSRTLLDKEGGGQLWQTAVGEHVQRHRGMKGVGIWEKTDTHTRIHTLIYMLDIKYVYICIDLHKIVHVSVYIYWHVNNGYVWWNMCDFLLFLKCFIEHLLLER